MSRRAFIQVVPSSGSGNSAPSIASGTAERRGFDYRGEARRQGRQRRMPCNDGTDVRRCGEVLRTFAGFRMHEAVLFGQRGRRATAGQSCRVWSSLRWHPRARGARTPCLRCGCWSLERSVSKQCRKPPQGHSAAAVQSCSRFHELGWRSLNSRSL